MSSSHKILTVEAHAMVLRPDFLWLLVSLMLFGGGEFLGEKLENIKLIFLLVDDSQDF